MFCDLNHTLKICSVDFQQSFVEFFLHEKCTEIMYQQKRMRIIREIKVAQSRVKYWFKVDKNQIVDCVTKRFMEQEMLMGKPIKLIN